MRSALFFSIKPIIYTVHFESPLLFSYSPPYFPGQVDVPKRKMTVPDQAVKGAFADHDLVSVMDTDVVDRLLLPDEGRHDFLEPGDLFV